MKAIITRNDQPAVLELPTSRMELAGFLNQIGVRTPAHIIPCSDEEEDYIKVKLFGESDFENELMALVTPKDSLGSVNTALDLYRELPQTQKEKLNVELSQNPPDSLSSLCQKVMDFQPKYVTERGYLALAEGMKALYPQLCYVALTERRTFSAEVNSFCAKLYDGENLYSSEKYRMEIVDRVGGGDAFAAGLIYALRNGKNARDAVRFAAAAGCLKHTVEGDMNPATVAEIEALANGNATGRVQR